MSDEQDRDNGEPEPAGRRRSDGDARRPGWRSSS